MNYSTSPSQSGAAPAMSGDDAKARIQNMTTRERLLAIIGGSSGNLVEWYDFYVYSSFALYFAHAFFPSGDRTTQLLNAAGVFAIGFLMRPIGGWLFGRLADRAGRRASMMLSVLMMAGGSLVIAVVPTHESIGIAAPIILVLARMFQGLSVGGEYGTSATYMSEVADPKHRGFYSSFQYVTLIGGQLLALLVLVVLQAIYPRQELLDWAWRIPFFIGAATALLALWLRRSLKESTTEASRKQRGAGTIAALMQHWKPVLQVLGLTAGGSLAFYTYTTYMQKFLVNSAGFSAESASVTMTVVLFIYMLLQPVIGALSDRIGRRNSLIIFGLFVAIITVPLLGALHGVHTPVAAGVLITLALLVVSFYTSVSGLVKAELFPAEIRALGVGLSYAIANALFGGSAEYVALRFKAAGNETGFYWYVTGLAILALVVAISLKDTRRDSHLVREAG